LEIAERNGGAENVVLVGIVRRGAFLAERIASELRVNGKREVPVWHARYFLLSRRR